MKQYVRSVASVSVALAGLGFFGLTEGCSSTPESCDSSRCATGNECVNDGKETKCRLLCETHGSCPANFHCATSATKTFCQENKTAFAKSGKGQWGARCNAQAGLDANPDCDSDQYFWCYGVSPTDGEAFCTQYDCSSDDECAGGWYCGTVNSFPDVRTLKRAWGQTRRVCLPRTYCAPCATDLDCKPAGAAPQYCVTGSDGAKFCSTECANDGTCNQDAKCSEAEGAPVNVCVPRAGTCKGDGALCSPCRSDADCTNGVCATSPYSRERFCTEQSTSPCVEGEKPTGCPAKPAGTNWIGPGCTTADGDTAPKNQCYGAVQLKTDNEGQPLYLPGCFTPNRK